MVCCIYRCKVLSLGDSIYTIIIGGARGVIVVGNGHGEPNLNPGRG